MRDETKLAVLLGRLLELMIRSPEISDDHRTTMHALAEILGRRSASLVLVQDKLSVEGEPVPEDTPFVYVVRERLKLHQVGRLNLAHGASAVDLVELLRALAAAPQQPNPADMLARRLTAGNVTNVTVVSRDQEVQAAARREVRVTAALTASGIPPAPAPPPAGAPTGPGAGVRPSAGTKAAGSAERPRAPRRSGASLAGLVEQLQDETNAQPLLNRLDTLSGGIVKAIGANELTTALEAILRLIRQEAEATNPDTQRQYGIALRRLLTAEHLKKFAPMAFDEMYHDDVALLMRRAGKQGTKILLDLLIEAPSQAERRAFLKAIRQVEEGADVIASLLNHHEWFVVRNAADLVGEMRIVDAVPALSRVAQHDEPRVRRAVGLALAQIGTAETALPLRRLIADPDPQVRVAVVKAVGGRTLSGLAMPLVSTASSEMDPEVLGEYYRALGRIGTPDAVAALVKAAQDSGGLLSRKPIGPRLAAIEALGVAGGAAATAVLKELLQSRSADIRTASASALAQATASGE